MVCRLEGSILLWKEILSYYKAHIGNLLIVILVNQGMFLIWKRKTGGKWEHNILWLMVELLAIILEYNLDTKGNYKRNS